MVLLAALAFVLIPLSDAEAGTVDLNDWTAASYPAVSGFGAGSWAPAADGSSVYQSINGQPTFFFSDFTAFGTEVKGKIRVTGGDDDYIGFALGFLPGTTTDVNADYLLVDWKQGNQDYNFGSPSGDPGGIAYSGLAVSRVTGIPTADEFWQHTTYGTDGGLVELQRGATRGSTGWAQGVEYEFTFDFGPNDLEVFVNGTKELDITGSFANGRMAFYNFSQADVTYSAFEVDPGNFPTVPLPSSALMGGFALGFLFLVRKLRRK
jgi:Thrombospondin C-terminal region